VTHPSIIRFVNFRHSRLFFGYSASKRLLVVRATSMAFAVRCALWIVPSRVVLRLVEARVRRQLARPPGRERFTAGTLAWGVRIAARRVPHATCLTQGLVMRLLLAENGIQSILRIGVGRNEKGKFDAHAWVEIEEGVIIGGEQMHRFVPLPDLTPAVLERS
jgi:hypothetical protein